MSPLPALPAIVEGRVRHHRRMPTDYRFSTWYAAWLLDLAERPAPPTGLRRLVRVDPRDHLEGPESLAALRRAALALLVAGGALADATQAARVVLWAQPRVGGRIFNPISVYLALDVDDAPIAALLEVDNTYGGRHTYALTLDEDGAGETDKAFYVSPFNDLSGRYAVHVRLGRRRCVLVVNLVREDRVVLATSMWGTPRALTARRAAAVLVRHPGYAARASTLIRYHGVRLWLRRLPIADRAEFPTKGSLR